MRKSSVVLGGESIACIPKDLRFKTSILFLNQDQGSVFTVRKCAQSIPRLEKPKNRRFSHKNPKMFDFRFNTPIPSLNQSQGSVFKAINSPHKFTPRGSFVKKFSTRPCFGLHPEDNSHYKKRLIIRH